MRKLAENVGRANEGNKSVEEMPQIFLAIPLPPSLSPSYCLAALVKSGGDGMINEFSDAGESEPLFES